SFLDFTSRFGRGVEGEQISQDSFGPTYKTKLRWLYEYIFRKDYHNNWETELEELYGFWTMNEALTLVGEAGFEMLHSERVRNPWIIENRLRGKIRVFDGQGNAVDFPDYQMIVVAQKPL
ncbi:MAG: hypothetical protein HRT45_13550, partial [Bdellovibrionales bacterium]|nr:hypothetical protein [Bdellovibrionales bacterium]